MPSNVVILAGKISDDGLPLGAAITTQWSQVSGPLPVTFSTPASSSTQVGFPAAGTYVLQLAASDSQLTGSATISITVNAIGTNQAPTVAIIADHTSITLPTNTVTLNGVINDDGLPNGTISTQWAQISGPVAVNIAQVTSTSVKVSFPAAGVYVIKLTANDGQLSSEATITITVTTSGGNQPPTVSAGPSQSLQLPQNTLTLTGYAADDGLPAGSTLLVNWSEISGPANVSFSNPGSVVTQASFPVAGVYVLQLSANDSQLQTTAQVTVTVVNAPVPPPTPPSVSLTGFADGAEITKPTPIVGSVTTGNWKLEYSLLDGSGNPDHLHHVCFRHSSGHKRDSWDFRSHGPAERTVHRALQLDRQRRADFHHQQHSGCKPEYESRQFHSFASMISACRCPDCPSPSRAPMTRATSASAISAWDGR